MIRHNIRTAEQIVAGDWVSVTNSIYRPTWMHVFAVWYHYSGLGTASRRVGRQWTVWRKAQLADFRHWRHDPTTIAAFPYNYLIGTNLLLTEILGSTRQIFQEEITCASLKLNSKWSEYVGQVQVDSTATKPRQRSA